MSCYCKSYSVNLHGTLVLTDQPRPFEHVDFELVNSSIYLNTDDNLRDSGWSRSKAMDLELAQLFVSSRNRIVAFI